MRLLIAALCLCLVALPAAAQQVPKPINAPSSIAAGNAFCGSGNAQQSVDCGTGTFLDHLAGFAGTTVGVLQRTGTAAYGLLIGNPIMVGATVPAGHAYCATATPAQGVDCGTGSFLDTLAGITGSGIGFLARTGTGLYQSVHGNLMVGNVAALKALTLPWPMVTTSGYTTYGDGGQNVYYYNASACAAADGGSQIQATGQSGCWIAQFPTNGANVMSWGCAGNGTTDDTTCLTNAFKWADTSGIPLRFDATHTAVLKSQITSTGSPTITGTNGHILIYNSCPYGIKFENTSSSALVFYGATGAVTDMCIQMNASVGGQTGGWAIYAGTQNDSATEQGSFHIERNTVVNAMGGIEVGGSTRSLQTQGTTVRDNVIINPSYEGIAIGEASVGGTTNGTVLIQNEVYCQAAGSHASATGIAIRDVGGLYVEAGPSGPYNCNIGTAMIPGTVGGYAQNCCGGTLMGVLGDSSGTYDLEINPGSGGALQYVQLIGAWASAVTTADTPVFVDRGSGTCENVIFSGLQVNMAGGNNVGIYLNGCQNIVLSGTSIGQIGGGTSNYGIYLNTSRVGAAAITGTVINVETGALTTCIGVTDAGSPGSGIVNITGNILTNCTAPVSGTYSGADNYVIQSNTGIDNGVYQAVATASSITLPAWGNYFELTGTSSITTISSTNSWNGRTVKLVPYNGNITLVAGGGNICGPGTTIAQSTLVTLIWSQNFGCWFPNP
jgi:hypothetical protein